MTLVRRVFALAICLTLSLGSLASSAHALPLAPGGNVPVGLLDPTPLGVMGLIPVAYTSSTVIGGPNGSTLVSAVYSNPGLGGAYLFAYQLIPSAIGGYAVSLYNTTAPWAGALISDVGSDVTAFPGFLAGGLAPTNGVSRQGNAAQGVSFSYANNTDITAPAVSTIVWLQTLNVKSYTVADGQLQDGEGNFIPRVLAPVVPEPSRLVGMLSLAGVLGLGCVWRRRRAMSPA